MLGAGKERWALTNNGCVRVRGFQKERGRRRDWKQNPRMSSKKHWRHTKGLSHLCLSSALSAPLLSMDHLTSSTAQHCWFKLTPGWSSTRSKSPRPLKWLRKHFPHHFHSRPWRREKRVRRNFFLLLKNLPDKFRLGQKWRKGFLSAFSSDVLKNRRYYPHFTHPNNSTQGN